MPYQKVIACKILPVQYVIPVSYTYAVPERKTVGHELIILFQCMCPLPRPSYAKKVCFGSYVIITGVAAYENDIVSSVVSPKEFMHIPDKCIIIECIFYEFILYVY